ncbi:MAG TPA: DNA polymerase III subunit gamma/tau [Bryobacteraceae bacterium]|jgi:DNA polymerase-3 subunit gamma/tau|nr:DNA polymerase III subunit gamma/tau [Bryobacteraceae bacterium]
MSSVPDRHYQVIARKYRPQTFDDLLNQEHIITTLRNAIGQNRIAHGYIFSGQRGTGKTTTARIVARCLNCEKGPTDHPCGECASCLEITAGGSVDVIEIDAASNRGINEMRELRENVRYQPARDKYKIFIIDEAHQITNEAFNALLKTIEEPPPWAVFVLCTTESHKIPATIASRCQHFSFRSVDFNDLIDRMRMICTQEGIETDDETLSVIAQSGEGSVRDSLSALDQAIACCGNKLEAAQVRALLGTFSLDAMAQVTTALSAQDGSAVLALVDDLERNGGSPHHFSRELSRYIRNLLVTKIAGPDSRLVTASPSERAEMARIGAAFSEEDLTRYLQLALDLFRDLQFSLQPRFHLEIGLLKMIQAGKLIAIEDALASLGTSPAPAPASVPVPPKPQAAKITGATGASPFEMDRAKKASPPPPAAPPATPIAAAPPSADDDWRAKLHGAMTATGLSFSADAITQSDVALVNGELQITAPKQFALGDLGREEVLIALKHLGYPTLRFKVNFGEAKGAALDKQAAMPKPAVGEDEVTERALTHPEVKRFRELFGGEVRTVRNLKEPWNE